MDWPSIIRRIKDRGVTQQQIADMCGELGAKVTQSAISDLESGKTKQPAYALGAALRQLADVAPTPSMSAAAKCVVLDTWAGRRYYAVEVVGETPKKARVRVLTPGGVMLPGRRYVQCGETVLVPKHALFDLPADAHKVEHGYYDGHVGGYGGTADAR